MSKTNHPTKYNFDTHPVWKYGWKYNHAPATWRKICNRTHRAKCKNAIRKGIIDNELVQDPPRNFKDAAWDYW